VDFQRIQNKKEAYYESVTLSIWSMSEVTAGIVVANLPPLRKSLESLLKRVIPSAGSDDILSRNKSLNYKFESYNLPKLIGRGEMEIVTKLSWRLRVKTGNRVPAS
jgi:hypothetical protein